MLRKRTASPPGVRKRFARPTSLRCFAAGGRTGFQLMPVIDRTFPFAEVAEAHGYLESGQGSGKVVLTVP